MLCYVELIAYLLDYKDIFSNSPLKSHLSFTREASVVDMMALFCFNYCCTPKLIVALLLNSLSFYIIVNSAFVDNGSILQSDDSSQF